MKIIGIILLALGILALVYQGITYTKRDKAVDAGPIQITTKEDKHIPLPPIVGIVACVCGVALIVVDSRKS